ncbi:MAG: hypothetical protein V4850_33400 [Myxococcota bacterium]
MLGHREAVALDERASVGVNQRIGDVMMVLLFFVLGCASPGGSHYDRCMRSYEVACKCGDYSHNSSDAEAACKYLDDPETKLALCEDYDLRRCNPKSERWDSEGCETVHALIEEVEESGSAAYQQCRITAYEKECPGPDLTTKEWTAAEQAAAEACVDLLPE